MPVGYQHSEQGARHARLKGDPPRRTMTLGEARRLIGALVTRWLDCCGNPPTPEAIGRSNRAESRA
jgi:hypothetical protein